MSWLNFWASMNIFFMVRHRARVPGPDGLVEGRGTFEHAFMVVTAAVFHLPMSWLNELASLNMCCMSVTCAVFQLLMSWLKAVASLNMSLMSSPSRVPVADVLVEGRGTVEHAVHVVTAAVSQFLMSWLKAVGIFEHALHGRHRSRVPPLMSWLKGGHEHAACPSPRRVPVPMGWSKEVAMETYCMVVTELVSQPLMSWLKAWHLGTCLMFVTELVSQSPMGELKAPSSLNNTDMSVTPVVHDLVSSGLISTDDVINRLSADPG